MPPDPSNHDLLKGVPLFSTLDDAALEALAARCRRRRFKAGDSLFHEGDPGHVLYVIVAGRVNIQSVTPGDQVIHIAQRGPGEPVGELALIDDKPRMADAVTAEPCDLLTLDRDAFRQAVREHPDLGLGIMAVLADRIRQAAGQVESLQTQDVLGRVAAILLELLEEHGTDPVPGGRRLKARVTQQELADRIGTRRESVNRALTRLKQVHALRGDGRQLVVLDEPKLRRYSTR